MDLNSRKEAERRKEGGSIGIIHQQHDSIDSVEAAERRNEGGSIPVVIRVPAA